MFGSANKQRLAEVEQRIQDLEAEHRGYTDIVTQALLDASADTVADAYVAALETAAGALSRAFAAAIPGGGSAGAFDAWTLAQVGRALVEDGEAVWYRSGQRIQRAETYDIQPSGAYQMNLAGTPFVVPANRVFHPRWNVNIYNGRGVGPLQQARNLRTMMQRLESSMAQELAAAVGYLLPLPTDGQSDTIDALKKQIADLKGQIAVIETTRAGWGMGQQSGPRREFDLQRLGPNIPGSSVDLYRTAREAVFTACGYPVDLAQEADGTGQREAWRRYLHGTVAPLGRLVIEAAGRAGLNLTLDWSNLFASDITGRARAFQSLVGGGMTLEQAAAASGILEPGD